jgi:HAD superfamily hydrolase (TIGR01549 family)
MSRPLAIFDFDGVLVDSVKYLEVEIREKLRELGYAFMETRDETLDLFEENIMVALIEHGLTPHHMCAIWERIREATIEGDLKMCRGAADMLGRLRGVSHMAVISSNATDAITSVLSRLGVADVFSKISGGEEALGKSVRIKRCMEEVGVRSSHTFYIGDTVGDVHEAREAGVGSVAVTWGMHPEKRLALARPDLIVREPEEIVDLIRTVAEEEPSIEGR